MTNDNTIPAGTAGLPAVLVYNNQPIHDQGDMLSLTDMWRAARTAEGRRPSDWLTLPSTKEFRSAVEATLVAGKSGIQTKRGGRGIGGSTLAHWQIALAYAKYLSPEFHMWCNTVVRERMQGAPQLAAPMPVDMKAIGGMVKGIVNRQMADALTSLTDKLLPAMLQAALATQNFAIRRGKTAGQIWKDQGFPPIRITSWFSNRLREMQCEIDGGGFGELGLTRARLFDPDKADAWLKNGGRLMVENKIAERRGQGTLRLVATHTSTASSL